MHQAIVFYICIFIISPAHANHAITKPPIKESADVNEFFDQIENVVENVMEDSKTPGIVRPSPNGKPFSVPKEERMKPQIEPVVSYSNYQTEAAYTFGNFPFQNKPVNIWDEAERRNGFLDFERYQEFVFRPLHVCDRYDSTRRSCFFYRQIGTTLTLGVYMGGGMHSGMRIYWYRCLKKKLLDNIVKEPLSKTFLPWNLNLGGTGNELRISPITEMDLGYNYFLAELVMPKAFQEKYGKKPSIRFTIEPISIDMGTLYHGEEIVIYARSFIELPRRSVSFQWSLFSSDEIEDLGLPSNMRLNSEKSSVVIKELRTHQDQILTCKAYSNKGVLLARRNFLFRGFKRDNSTVRTNHTRLKRSIADEEERDRTKLGTDALSSNVKQFDLKNLYGNTRFEWDEVFPEIPVNLFYDHDQNSPFAAREPHNRFLRSDDFNIFPSEDLPPENYEKFNQKDIFGSKKFSRSEEFLTGDDPKSSQLADKPRFEDVDSQTIATCLLDLDCNIYAICISAPLSGQKFCQCRHGYNGNGIFCFSN